MRLNSFCLKLISLALCLSSATVWAKVEIRNIDMKFDGKKYLMDLYETKSASGVKRPGVILVPDYWGKDQLDDVQARRLAEYGFAVLVVDLYGEGEHTTQNEVAARLVKDAETPDLENIVSMIGKAVDVLKAQPEVDPKDIGGVGFGYGGGLLWNLAKEGSDPSLKAIVSFYGGTKKVKAAGASGKGLPALLYFRPEYDVYTTADDLKSFETELKGLHMDFKMVDLPGAYHGFIHKTIDNYGNDMGKSFMIYDASAANVAWAKAKQFLDQKLLSNRVPNGLSAPKPAHGSALPNK